MQSATRVLDGIHLDDYAQEILDTANTISSTPLSVFSVSDSRRVPRMSSYLLELNRQDPKNPHNETRVYAIAQHLLRGIAKSPSTTHPSLDHELPRTAIADMVRKTRARRASKERRECACAIASLHSSF